MRPFVLFLKSVSVPLVLLVLLIPVSYTGIYIYAESTINNTHVPQSEKVLEPLLGHNIPDAGAECSV